MRLLYFLKVRILDKHVGLIFLAVHLTRAVVKRGNQQDISADFKIMQYNNLPYTNAIESFWIMLYLLVLSVG